MFANCFNSLRYGASLCALVIDCDNSLAAIIAISWEVSSGMS